MRSSASWARSSSTRATGTRRPPGTWWRSRALARSRTAAARPAAPSRSGGSPAHRAQQSTSRIQAVAVAAAAVDACRVVEEEVDVEGRVEGELHGGVSDQGVHAARADLRRTARRWSCARRGGTLGGTWTRTCFTMMSASEVDVMIMKKPP